MSAKTILKRVAAVKADVAKRAGYDKKNRADDLRGPLANQVMEDTKQAQVAVFGTEIDPLQEPDLNEASSATIGDLLFQSVEKGPQTQLLSVQIKDGATVGVKVKKDSVGSLVVITMDAGVSTNQDIQDAMGASSAASSLMTCDIAAGQEAELAVVAAPTELKGGA